MIRKGLYILLICALILGAFSTLSPSINSATTRQSSFAATSANLFGSLLNRSLLTIATPTLSSPNIAGPYVQGVPGNFTVTATNPTSTDYPGTGFVYKISNIKMADIATFDMGDGVNWMPMPLEQSGADVMGMVGPLNMNAGYDETSLFRIGFKKGGSYPVNIQLLDQNGTTVLATLDATIKLSALYSDDLSGPYQQDRPVIFTVAANNPTDTSYDDVLFSYTLSKVNLSDIETFDISADGVNWFPMELTQVGTDVTGGFSQPFPSTFDAGSVFRIIFKKGGSYPVIIQVRNNNGSKELIASMEASIKVNYGIYLPLLKR